MCAAIAARARVHARRRTGVDARVDADRRLHEQVRLGGVEPLLLGEVLDLPVVNEPELGRAAAARARDVQDVAAVRVAVEDAVDEYLVPVHRE